MSEGQEAKDVKDEEKKEVKEDEVNMKLKELEVKDTSASGSNPTEASKGTPVEGTLEKVILKANDGVEFQVDLKLAKMFVVVKDMLSACVDDSNTTVPLANVRGPILAKMVKWAEHHVDDPDTSDEEEQYRDRRTDDIPKWDQDMLAEMERHEVYEVLQACNFLDLKPLLEICCKTIVNWMRGKSVEEVRTMFGLVSDYTPEEEEKLKKENAWAEDLTN